MSNNLHEPVDLENTYDAKILVQGTINGLFTSDTPMTTPNGDDGWSSLTQVMDDEM